MDIRGFVKKEYLLVISVVLAILSLFLVPFETVLTYDYMRILRTICTLLFFLLIVAGLKECKALKKLAQLSVKKISTSFLLCAVLIFLPFFCAMLFSNDVALLTFVPLAVAILKFADMRNAMAPVMILQTLAANVGSYLTPFGNPHNLYMFNLSDLYGFTVVNYEMALIPIVIVGTIALIVMALLIPRKALDVDLEDVGEVPMPKVAAKTVSSEASGPIAENAPAAEAAPQAGDKVDNGIPEAKKSGDTHWVLIGISAATLVAGTTLAVVYNNKAKTESEKTPALRAEFNQRHDDIGKYQKFRTAGIGIAILGGIGLGLSIAF